MRIRIIALCRICNSFYVTKYLLLSKSLPFFFAGLSDYRVPGEEPQHHLWGTLPEAWQPQEAAGTQRAAQQGTGIFEELCFNQCGGFETFLSRSHFSFVFGFRSRSNFSWVVLSSFGSNGTYFIKHQYVKLVFVYYSSLPIRFVDCCVYRVSPWTSMMTSSLCTSVPPCSRISWPTCPSPSSLTPTTGHTARSVYRWFGSAFGLLSDPDPRGLPFCSSGLAYYDEELKLFVNILCIKQINNDSRLCQNCAVAYCLAALSINIFLFCRVAGAGAALFGWSRSRAGAVFLVRLRLLLLLLLTGL